MFCAGIAQAETCAQKISRLEKQIKRQPPPDAGETLPETTAAKLHRQPTAASVEQATRQSDADTLYDARLLEADGNEKGCLDKIRPLERK
jgi:hypothetical protein